MNSNTNRLSLYSRSLLVSVITLFLIGSICQFAAGATIADAKKMADNSSVSLSAKAVTYAGANFFYIEEDSRYTGIRVEKNAHGLTAGMRANVAGNMKTNTNKERYILATSAVHNGYGMVTPVYMNNLVLGGGNWQVVGTGGQLGVATSSGLNNIGLLVRIYGKYYQIDATNFTIDDGTRCLVKCTVTSDNFLDSKMQYVTVTGISSIYKANSTTYLPNLQVRDIDMVSLVESVSVPGTPDGCTNQSVNASAEYTISASTCSQGHPVEYMFNWGDGTSSPWSTSTSASHAWNGLGTNTVTVTARCQVNQSVGATSAGLQVNVVNGCREMIYIPAGSFLMGNNGSELYSAEDGLSQHSVNLSGYYIGKYEVTRGEYRQFVNAGGYTKSSYWSDAGWYWRVGTGRDYPCYWDAYQDWYGKQPFTQTDSHPVVGVTYYEAEAFCNWASGHLPTEAQWERAARWTGTHANVYPWGDVWQAEKCKHYFDDDTTGGGSTRYQTAQVGSHPSGASPSGCQDMAGNVWEWCQDWFANKYYSQSPRNDPQGPASGIERVLRGGSWIYDEYYGRCAYRNSYYPNFCFNLIGFRLAR